jgi:hypothetical protein
MVESSDRFMVIKPTEPGVIDVLDKAVGQWRRISIPFPQALIRGFGSWLGAIEITKEITKSAASTRVTPPGTASRAERGNVGAGPLVSPGAQKRRSEEIAPPFRRERALTVDDLFNQSVAAGIVYPGELLAYNIETGTQLRISTGSGDSEIVFINDSAVFYRVDDAIFRCDIHGSSLGQAIKLAESEEIAQVHWAFLN